MTEQGKDILRYADAAMYDAQPILKEEGVRVEPRVFLLSATPDPLGNLAADMRMYRGDPVYDLSQITDEQRKWAWEELSKTRLNTPLEGVTLKFMIEAVTRSFTHQMVRQRVGAYYVQESLRFAVKRGLAKECALPPSILDHSEAEISVHPPEGHEAWNIWDRTIHQIEEAYESLVALGIPAEDARGLLPHCVTTRIIYCTNLRALFDHAGNRLCTQAQFEWRSVFMGIMKAIKNYSTANVVVPDKDDRDGPGVYSYGLVDDGWQWELIGTPAPMTFAPVCYKTGKCEFMASLDRGCSIRDRVQEMHERGIPSSEWVGIGKPRYAVSSDGHYVPGIDPAEWMADPMAGITTEDNRPK